MTLEEDAQRAVDAERQEKRRRDALAKQFAPVDDVPRLRELLQLLRKYDVPTRGLYRLARSGTSVFGLGSPYWRYSLESRGWAWFDTTPDAVTSVVLVITEDERLYRGATMVWVGSNYRGIAHEDFVHEHALSLRDDLRLTLGDVQPDSHPGWARRIEGWAKDVVGGAG